MVREHHGAPLLNWSGLVLVRQLIERLGIVSAIRESDHILTLIYNILGGGTGLMKRVLGSDRIPHATTLGKFLWRFGDRWR